MNLDPKMMMEKLQLFVFFQMSNEQKVFLAQTVELIPNPEGSSKDPKSWHVGCYF
jgi:hypothetical protein